MPSPIKVAALVAAPALFLGGVLGFTIARGASAPVTTETREVSGFDEVELQGIGTLIITQGETESLSIEAEERVLPKIATEVVAGRLTIGPDRSFRTREPVTYTLTVKELTAIEVAGAARVEAAALDAGELELVVNGSAEVALDDLTADALEVTASGSADIELAGEVDRQAVELDGASEYRAADLASRAATVIVDGASKATVRVGETLDVRVGGAGSVEYVGDPTVSQEVSAAGKVTAIAPAEVIAGEQAAVTEVGADDEC